VDGSVLIADLNNNRIRRVDSRGLISTVGGTGECTETSDRVPAIAAEVCEPTDVVATADGGFLIAAHSVRRVAPGGIISRLASSGENLSLTRRGDVLVATDRRIRRIAIDGTARFVAGRLGPRSLEGVGAGLVNGDGGPPLRARVSPTSVSATPDGGFLIGDVGVVRYVAPPVPARFAVAIRRIRVGGGRIQVSYRTTTPARVVELRLRRGGRLVASRRMGTRRGRVAVRAPRPARGRHLLVVTVRDATGRVASDQVFVHLRRLGAVAARRIASELTSDDEATSHAGRCHRFGPRRVDCQRVEDEGGDCFIYAVSVRGDGLTYARLYSVLPEGSCRFERRPRWDGEPQPAFVVASCALCAAGARGGAAGLPGMTGAATPGRFGVRFRRGQSHAHDLELGATVRGPALGALGRDALEALVEERAEDARPDDRLDSGARSTASAHGRGRCRADTPPPRWGRCAGTNHARHSVPRRGGELSSPSGPHMAPRNRPHS
jgi:hypothetical protein